MSSLGNWASLFPSGWKMAQGGYTILLQKDMSPVHAATVTIKRLRSVSGSRSSPKAPPSRGHRGPRTLPHQLSTLWGHVKEKTYKREPRNLPELKAAVTEYVRAVTARECRRVLAELRRRVEICLARNGDILMNCPSFQGEAQTVMTNDGTEFPMFTD